MSRKFLDLSYMRRKFLDLSWGETFLISHEARLSWSHIRRDFLDLALALKKLCEVRGNFFFARVSTHYSQSCIHVNLWPLIVPFKTVRCYSMHYNLIEWDLKTFSLTMWQAFISGEQYTKYIVVKTVLCDDDDITIRVMVIYNSLKYIAFWNWQWKHLNTI